MDEKILNKWTKYCEFTLPAARIALQRSPGAIIGILNDQLISLPLSLANSTARILPLWTDIILSVLENKKKIFKIRLMSKILCISPVLSHPSNLGNKVHITRMLKNIQQSGRIIHFLHVGFEIKSQQETEATAKHWDKFFFVKYKFPFQLKFIGKYLSQQKNEKCIPWDIDDWYDPGIEPFVKELQQKEKYDVVIVQYIFFSKVFSCFDQSVLKMLNTLNVFTDRHKIFIENGEISHNFYTSLEQEKIGLNRADLICAIQESECEFFLKLTDKPVITIGNPVKITKSEFRSSTMAKIILFVGSQHQPNVKSMTHFLKHIYPEIRKLEPAVSLEIVGSVFHGSPPSTFPEGCCYQGVVDNLNEFYERAAVVINPMLFGTGLNIKMIEALGYGKPTVTTTVGARGLLSGQSDAYLIADSDNDFAHAVVRLLNDHVYADKLAKEARKFAVSYNQACQKPLLKYLDQHEKKMNKAEFSNQSSSNV